MRVLSLVLLMMVLVFPVAAQSVTPTVTPTPEPELVPLLMLDVYDVWRGAAVEGNGLQFVIYDDMSVIYWDSDEAAYMTVTLEFYDMVAFIQSFPLYSLIYMDDFYMLVERTDQPIQTIWLNDDNFKARINAHGRLLDDVEARENAPEELVEVYDALQHFSHEDAVLWTPDTYWVRLQKDTRIKNAVAWSEAFPQIGDEAFVDSDGMFGAYLTADEYEIFTELTEDADAFEIDGETYLWAVQWVFPAQDVWQTIDTDE